MNLLKKINKNTKLRTKKKIVYSMTFPENTKTLK